MSRVSFRQADIERILRAAKNVGATVQVDIKTLVVTIFHPTKEAVEPLSGLVRYGEENWDDEDDWKASV
ncbi:hypothetical protein [Rhizobium mongolense]|uniref:Uncharacterized protein n=2 Tax=Rhizobium mongolense TaxID=57676 RepID=A0ABR6IKY2_9HYPH|nr:hypothetical protein [Rhizobium mongolense]MBB4228512.1 hypothetical protein [Rhizobium mongolense]TVZ64354.1 hypothetical protein BCL32_4594 [Rhizobium mongolense USDA 1844]